MINCKINYFEIIIVYFYVDLKWMLMIECVVLE